MLKNVFSTPNTKYEKIYIMRITMGKLKKDAIIRSITDKQIYDIKYELAVDAVKDISYTKCYRYSMYHYKTMYTIIKKKLDTFSNAEDKIAYLDCLRINYIALSKYDSLDVIASVFSGGFLGLSFFDKTNDVLYKTISIVSITVFICIKIYIMCTRKWDFYNNIIESLKNDIIS